MNTFLKSFDQTLFHRSKTPHLFRRDGGPREIDFAFDMFVERIEERKKIVFGVFSDRFHVLIGSAASGKTTLVRDIGRYIRNQGYHEIWVLEAGDIKHDSIQDCIKDIAAVFSTLKENGIIIFENIHRSFEPANEVAEFLISQGIMTIFTTRPESIEFYTDVKYDNQLLALYKQNKDRYSTTIRGSDLVDKIVDEACLHFGRTLEKNECKQLHDLVEGDLWKLSFLLESYRAFGTVDPESLWQQISNEIARIEYEVAQPLVHVVANLALFGKYEIPVPKTVAIAIFGKKAISALELHGLIEEENGAISFFHSSIASLYVLTFLHTHKVLSDEQEDFVNCAEKIISKNQNVLPTILKRLCLQTQLLEILLDRQIVQNAIAEYFMAPSTSLSSAADVITDCCRKGSLLIAQQVTNILESTFQAICEKIDNDNDIEEISFFLGSIPWFVRSESKQLVAELGEHLGVIARTDHPCPFAILSSQSSGILEHYAKLLQLPPIVKAFYPFLQPCTRVRGQDNAFMCGKSLLCDASDLNMRLVEEIDAELLGEKLDKWPNTFDVVTLLHTIYWVDINRNLGISRTIVSKLNELDDKLMKIPEQTKQKYAIAVVEEIRAKNNQT